MGGIGVLVFFVLSGYLIARIVARSFDAPHSYIAFIRRRVVRLGPVIAALAIVVPIVLVATRAADLPSALIQGTLVLTQTSAFAIAGDVSVHPALVPMWSLTVEWTFYLLFPACFAALSRRGRKGLPLARDAAICAVVLYLLGLVLEPKSFYVLPVANLGVMMLGAALGLAHHAGWTGPERLRLGIWPTGGLLIILLWFFVPGDSLSWGYKLAALPTTALAATLVINGCAAGHLVRRFLSVKFLTFIGVRAYSLYVWHVLVLWLTWVATGSSSWATAALACCAMVLVVEVSYRLLEVPALREVRKALEPRIDHLTG